MIFRANPPRVYFSKRPSFSPMFILKNSDSFLRGTRKLRRSATIPQSSRRTESKELADSGSRVSHAVSVFQSSTRDQILAFIGQIDAENPATTYTWSCKSQHTAMELGRRGKAASNRVAFFNIF